MAEKVNEDLFKAARDGSLSDLKAALKAGADINYNRRSTPLYIAACFGHLDAVKLLLRKGASLVQRSKTTFMCPLHGAAFNGHTGVVEVLVHLGATVDIRDGFQMTPIMYACSRGHVDTVRRLIEFGARVDLVSRDNWTPFTICMIITDKPHMDNRKADCLQLIIGVLRKRCCNPTLRCCNTKCGKSGFRSDLKLCAGCRLTRYCSRDCQKQHWSVGHKKCCGHDDYSGPPPRVRCCLEDL